MDFELLGDIAEIEIIAVNLAIREIADLKAGYGGRRRSKLKGNATIRQANGNVRRAPLARANEIKRLLD